MLFFENKYASCYAFLTKNEQSLFSPAEGGSPKPDPSYKIMTIFEERPEPTSTFFGPLAALIQTFFPLHISRRQNQNVFAILIYICIGHILSIFIMHIYELCTMLCSLSCRNGQAPIIPSILMRTERFSYRVVFFANYEKKRE